MKICFAVEHTRSIGRIKITLSMRRSLHRLSYSLQRCTMASMRYSLRIWWKWLKFGQDSRIKFYGISLRPFWENTRTDGILKRKEERERRVFNDKVHFHIHLIARVRTLYENVHSQNKQVLPLCGAHNPKLNGVHFRWLSLCLCQSDSRVHFYSQFSQCLRATVRHASLSNSFYVDYPTAVYCNRIVFVLSSSSFYF